MVERLKGLGAPSDESAGYPEFISSAEALAQAEDNVKLASERKKAKRCSEAETEASSALASFQSAATSFGFEQMRRSAGSTDAEQLGRRIGRRRSSEGGRRRKSKKPRPKKSKRRLKQAAPARSKKKAPAAAPVWAAAPKAAAAARAAVVSGGIGPG